MKLKTALASMLLLAVVVAGGALGGRADAEQPSQEVAATEQNTAQASWHTDWEAAAKDSETSGKPILIDFTGSDWCIWCIRLKQEVFDTPEFQAWAQDNVVLLELDFPRNSEQSEEMKRKNEELAQKYNIEGFPTILFTDHKGEVIGRYGYDEGGPATWIPKAEELLGSK